MRPEYNHAIKLAVLGAVHRQHWTHASGGRPAPNALARDLTAPFFDTGTLQARIASPVVPEEDALKQHSAVSVSSLNQNPNDMLQLTDVANRQLTEKRIAQFVLRPRQREREWPERRARSAI